MIGRLLGGLLAAFAYLCIGTVIAQAIIVGYLVSKWHVDRERILHVVAAAQGIDLTPPKPEAPPEPKEQVSEQLSFDQILDARATKIRDVELREQALKNGADQLRFEQNRLGDERLAFQNTKKAFEEDLTTVQKRATDGGWDETRRVLLAAKPKQAKELVLKMLDKNELDAVVALMSPMPDNRRSKIIAEFKSPDEVKKIDEILREIRRGEPLTDMTANTRQQLDQANSAAAPQGRP